MKNKNPKQKSTLQKVNEWVNGDNDNTPTLRWIWAFTDNVTFQYGNLKAFEYDLEAYWGLVNGIGFFPSVLNFGWLKIGFPDLHFDVINAIIHFVRNCLKLFEGIEDALISMVMTFLVFDILFSGTHLLSFKIFSGIKIRLISIGMCLNCLLDKEKREKLFDKDDIKKGTWYYKEIDTTHSNTYLFFLPRIEINIPELIKYFSEL